MSKYVVLFLAIAFCGGVGESPHIDADLAKRTVLVSVLLRGQKHEIAGTIVQPEQILTWLPADGVVLDPKPETVTRSETCNCDIALLHVRDMGRNFLQFPVTIGPHPAVGSHVMVLGTLGWEKIVIATYFQKYIVLSTDHPRPDLTGRLAFDEDNQLVGIVTGEIRIIMSNQSSARATAVMPIQLIE